MKKLSLAAAAVAALVSLVGCASIDITTDYDRSADFSSYKTFETQSGAEVKSQLVYDRFAEAVVETLTQKGLQHRSEGTDLLVVLHGRLSKQTQIDTTSYGYAYGGWGYYGRGYGGGSTVSTVREVPVGTLIIDVVDAKAKKLVWQAVASHSLDPNASPETRERRIRDAVLEIFSRFPPPPKK